MYYISKRLVISASHHLELSYPSKCSQLHGHNWTNLNEVLPCNPTAENIAKWVCDQLPQCYRVDVQESEGNMATYEKDED